MTASIIDWAFVLGSFSVFVFVVITVIVLEIQYRRKVGR